MNHTPKPWRVDIFEKETIIESPTQTICTNVSNCDADLIAAAPDLYEVAEWVIGKWKSGHHIPPDLLLKAREALVKAQGV